MTIKEIMQNRRSIRKFNDRPIPEELLEEVISMAITAPSASNKQPWRFLICSNKDIINKMAESVQDSIDTVSPFIQKEFLQAFENYGNYFVRFASAPTVIIPICRRIQTLSHLVSDKVANEIFDAIQKMEEKSAVISTSLAIQNLMLYAHNIGLGTSCVTGPLLAENELKRILNVPNGWDIPCLVPVGYPDEEPTHPGRKNVNKQIKWIR